MAGFINVRIPLLLRRAITMIPAIVVLAVGVSPTSALVLSQVVLSFGIPLALIPLVMLTCRRDIMGVHVNGRLTTIAAWGCALPDQRAERLPALSAVLHGLSHLRHGSIAPARARSADAGPAMGASPSTWTSPSRSIVSRFDRSIGAGAAGHGVSTTARTSSPAARATRSVSSVWLIVPSPGRAAMTRGSPSSTARSQTE